MLILRVNFLAYSAGPFINAMPTMALIIAIVNNKQNIYGANINEGKLNTAISKNNAATPKLTNALVIFLPYYLLPEFN